MIAQARRGDGLVGFSTSGNSDNLIKAFVKAKEMGVTTIGLAGMSGGEMAKLGLDHCLVVETDSIHRIQECHRDRLPHSLGPGAYAAGGRSRLPVDRRRSVTERARRGHHEIRR